MKKSSRAAANSAMKRARQRSGGNPNASRWLDGDHPTAKTLNRFERSVVGQGLAFFVAIIGLVALLWTLWAIRDDLTFRQQERENWRLDRIDRAWNRVLRKVGGNTGKGNALSFLLREGEDLSDLDLSCKAMGGMENGKCVKPINLTDFEFGSSDSTFFAPDSAVFNDTNSNIFKVSDVSQSEITGPRIFNAIMHSDFSGTHVLGGAIINSNLSIMSDKDTHFERVDFTNTHFDLGNFTKIRNSDMSNAFINFSADVPDFHFESNYFSANAPPRCFFPNPSKNTNAMVRGTPWICPDQLLKRMEICASLTIEQKELILGKEKLDAEGKIDKRLASKAPQSSGCKFRLFQFNKPAWNLTLEQAKLLYPDIYK